MPLKWNEGEERMLLLLLFKQAPKFTVDIDQLIRDWGANIQAQRLSGTPTLRGASDRIRLLKQAAGGMNVTARGGSGALSVAHAAHAAPATSPNVSHAVNHTMVGTGYSTCTIGRTTASTDSVANDPNEDKATPKLQPSKSKHRAKITATTDPGVFIKPEPLDSCASLGIPADFGNTCLGQAVDVKIKNEKASSNKRKRSQTPSSSTHAASEPSTVSDRSTEAGSSFRTSDSEDSVHAETPIKKRRAKLTRRSKTPAVGYKVWFDGPEEDDIDKYSYSATRWSQSDGSRRDDESGEDEYDDDHVAGSPDVKIESGDEASTGGNGKCRARAKGW